MSYRLWHDVHISVTCQGESIFGPSILENLLSRKLAKIVKRGLAEVTITFENIRLDYSVSFNFELFFVCLPFTCNYS